MNWDMEMEHRHYYKNKKLIKFIEKSIDEIDAISEYMYLSGYLYPSAFATEIVKIKNNNPEKSIKSAIWDYFCFDFGKGGDKADFFESPLNAEPMLYKNLTDALFNIYNLELNHFEDDELYNTKKIDLEHYNKLINDASDYLEKNFGKNPKFYKISGHKRNTSYIVMEEVYLGILVRIYLLVFDKYVIMIFFGCNE